MPSTNAESLKAKISKLADSIRTKSGTTDKMTLDGMADAIDSLKGSGYSIDDITKWLDTGYSDTSGITVALAKSLTAVPPYAFSGKRFDGGLLTFDKATALSDNSFYSCQFQKLAFPVAKTIKQNAFQTCYVTELSVPEVMTVGSSAFQGLVNLEYLNLPKVSSIGSYLCYRAGYLKKVKLGGDIEKLDAGSGWAYFYECLKLTHIILSGNTVPTLKDAGALFGYLSGSNAESGNSGYGQMKKGCRIYVPQALLNDYKTATNWSVYADYILPIEEHQQECLLPGDEGYVEEASA